MNLDNLQVREDCEKRLSAAIFVLWVRKLNRWNICLNIQVYKGEKCRSLKLRQQEHRNAVVRGEIKKKSGMADHVWKEKMNHLPLSVNLK